MSTTTTNYQLIKPELTDPADITKLNENWDKLDSQLKTFDEGKAPTDHGHAYLPLTGGNVTGTVIISKVQDAEADSYTEPPLVVGGTPNEPHLELDNNEIQAKTNENTPGNLFLNSGGGVVNVGEGGLKITDTAAIFPETALNSSIGTADLPFGRLYSRYLWVYGEANASYGGLRVGYLGTTSAEGTTILELGNSTATGNANNASSKITMYGKGTGFTNILPNENTSGSNAVTLPTLSGTLAIIASGSYSGTGKGTSSKVSDFKSTAHKITLPFEPKLLIVGKHGGATGSQGYVHHFIQEGVSTISSGTTQYLTGCLSGKVFYAGNSNGDGLDVSGTTYDWVALA